MPALCADAPWHDRPAAPPPSRGGGDHLSARIEAQADLILKLVEEINDITLMELQDRLAEHGLASPSARNGASSIAMPSLGKKTAHAAEQDRPEILIKRQAIAR